MINTLYGVMRTIKILITSLFFAVAAMQANAQFYSDRDHDSGTDTLCVYNSWQSVFYNGPDTLAINPNVEIYSPFHYKFKPTEKDSKPLRKMIEKQSVAVAIGDSLWLVNSKFIKDSLSGPYNDMFDDYLPLFFNEKIAFIQYLSTEISYLSHEIDDFNGLGGYMGVGRSSFFATGEGYYNVAHFVIDFENKTLFLVDKNYLLFLLDRYPDLKRRYEMMQDQNQFYLINEFFWYYVDRLEQELTPPDWDY